MINFFRCVRIVVKLLPSNINIQTHSDEFHVKVAQTLDEACKLLEVGFEYVCDMENVNVKNLRKRQWTP